MNSANTTERHEDSTRVLSPSESDILRTVAETYGVATEFYASGGDKKRVSNDSLVRILVALSALPDTTCIDTITEEICYAAIEKYYDTIFSQYLPPCLVVKHGDAHVFTVHVDDGAPAYIHITCEDGHRHGRDPQQRENWTPPRIVNGTARGEASFALPDDIPLGWHTLTLETTLPDGTPFCDTCDLVVTPRRIPATAELERTPTQGVMAQFYSVRSKDSWGIGDFVDLGALAEILARTAHADFLLINPTHAGQPYPPIENSPYLPTSRLFLDPIYIRPDAISEYSALDPDLSERIATLLLPIKEKAHTTALLDRDTCFSLKLAVLREIFFIPRTQEREHAYRTFVEEEGSLLTKFALWCAEAVAKNEKENSTSHATSHHYIPPDTTVDPEDVDFYCWLQWVAHDQLLDAHNRAQAAGMRIGLIADLAIGVHPGGADAALLAPVLAPKASVGAPPDLYNQQGQDWSQPPWNPYALAEASYKPWRDIIRAALRTAGGLRIDHILGMFRLWWIPRGRPSTTGTYVRYDYSAMIGILALEAQRAGAVIIGEDLGTFEPWVRDVLAERGILGTSMLWFETTPEGGIPLPCDQYRRLSLASITTQDAAPARGYLRGDHIRLRSRLGLLTRPSEIETAEDEAWRDAVMTTVAGSTWTHLTDLEQVAALHAFIAQTPSLLHCAALVDLVGDAHIQNQPGTTNDVYPNWCIPLSDDTDTPIFLEDIPNSRWLHTITEALREPTAHSKE